MWKITRMYCYDCLKNVKAGQTFNEESYTSLKPTCPKCGGSNVGYSCKLVPGYPLGDKNDKRRSK